MEKKEVVIEVGMGATLCGWTDKTPATVIEVHDTWFRVREDSYKRIDKNGMSESQEYEYSPNPEGATYTFTKRKNGRWVQKGCAMGKGTKVSVGVRRAWYDFSF